MLKQPITESIAQVIEQVIERARAKAAFNSLIHFDVETLKQSVSKLESLTASERDSYPLFGIGFVAKDNIDTMDMPTSGGTPSLKGKTPLQDAPVIAKLRQAGAILVGKANMHELAFGITSNNITFGAVRNPYNPNKIAGGSSGGTAAAIAAGIVDVGLGTDTGGSIRIPAALCGVVGFRPSMGRYDGRGVMPLSHTRDTIGVMARSVELIARFDSVIANHVIADDVIANDWRALAQKDMTELRFGVPKTYFRDGLHKDVASVFEQALEKLTQAGATLIEADLENVTSLNEAISFPVVLFEVVRDLPAYLKQRGQVDFETLSRAVISLDVKAVLQAAMTNAIPEETYHAAINIHRPALQQSYKQYFDANQCVAMLLPTTALPACDIGDDETTILNGTTVPTFPTYIRNTDPASNAGMPAITVPAGLSCDRLPIGLELVGYTNTDRDLLGYAAQVSAILADQPLDLRN